MNRKLPTALAALALTALLAVPTAAPVRADDGSSVPAAPSITHWLRCVLLDRCAAPGPEPQPW